MNAGQCSVSITIQGREVRLTVLEARELAAAIDHAADLAALGIESEPS